MLDSYVPNRRMNSTCIYTLNHSWQQLKYIKHLKTKTSHSLLCEFYIAYCHITHEIGNTKQHAIKSIVIQIKRSYSYLVLAADIPNSKANALELLRKRSP